MYKFTGITNTSGQQVDVKRTYFDTAHFSDSLQKYPFQGGGCYLLLGRVEVDFYFPTITITKMAKMPFIPDPRFAADEKRLFKYTGRYVKNPLQAYPQEHEIGLPRHRLKM